MKTNKQKLRESESTQEFQQQEATITTWIVGTMGGMKVAREKSWNYGEMRPVGTGATENRKTPLEPLKAERKRERGRTTLKSPHLLTFSMANIPEGSKTKDSWKIS